MDQPIRCSWAGSDPLYLHYHDTEWGVPVHDDRLLFEMLTLEGAQAGLSWSTILQKRENYRAAFDNFEPAIVAQYGEAKIAELLDNPGIVRNRLKIRAAVRNAQAYLKVQEEFGTFDAYIWQFVGGEPIINSWASLEEIPAQTIQSAKMSQELKSAASPLWAPPSVMLLCRPWAWSTTIPSTAFAMGLDTLIAQTDGLIGGCG